MRCDWGAVVVAAMGCGRVDFDGVADARGVAADDGTVDAGLPVLGPFGTPVVVGELSGGCDKGVSLTDDFLEIFWDSDRGPTLGAGDVWTATRATPTSTWDAPVHLTALSTTNDEDTPHVRGDGLAIYVASPSIPSGGPNGLFRATRATRTSAWSALALATDLDSPADEFSPWVSVDETVAIFESNRGAGGLWTSTRASATQPWATPVHVDEVTVNAGAPWLDPSQRVLYFTRTTFQGIAVATRASRTDPFSNVTPVAELGTTSGDAWLSPDLSTVYYADNCQIMSASR